MDCLFLILIVAFGGCLAAEGQAPHSKALIKADDTVPALLHVEGKLYHLPFVTAPVRLGKEAIALTRIALSEISSGPVVPSRTALKTRRDRYGRAFSDFDTADGSLVLLLVEKGALILDFDQSPGAMALDREATARRLKQGLWGHPDFAPITPLQAADQGLDYHRIIGRILSRGSTSRTWYLNFGKTWKTDFTATISRSLDPKLLGGLSADLIPAHACVEIRGWLMERDGPWINIVHPAQITTLTPENCSPTASTNR